MDLCESALWATVDALSHEFRPSAHYGPDGLIAPSYELNVSLSSQGTLGYQPHLSLSSGAAVSYAPGAVAGGWSSSAPVASAAPIADHAGYLVNFGHGHGFPNYVSRVIS